MKVLPEIFPFSNGYWLVTGFEIVSDDDVGGPLLQDHLYGYIQEEYYGNASTPITFHHLETNTNFVVEPDASPSIGTIRMKPSFIDDLGAGTSPETTELLLAKPRQSELLTE